MRETSFGKLDILLKNGNRPSIEHLIFEKEGRDHKHKEYEYFFVMKGEGYVSRDGKIEEIKPGDLINVPPMCAHRMWPKDGETLEAFLWYDSNEVNLI